MDAEDAYGMVDHLRSGKWRLQFEKISHVYLHDGPRPFCATGAANYYIACLYIDDNANAKSWIKCPITETCAHSQKKRHDHIPMEYDLSAAVGKGQGIDT